MARERIHFQGLPSRICWLGYGERAKFGLAMNELVAKGEIKAPIVIGRDHLDAGSVASPNRETEAMADGSDAIADWPLLNAMLNTAAGATWVSLHHGGGVGIGNSIHAGMVVVADGTEEAARRLERVLTTDPGMGVVRHVDAGYPAAKGFAKNNGIHHPDAGLAMAKKKADVLLTDAAQVVTARRRRRSARMPEPEAMNDLGVIENGAVAIRRRESRGRSARRQDAASETYDAERSASRAAASTVLPGFVDSHTHPVFAKPRVDEFALRTPRRGLRGDPRCRAAASTRRRRRFARRARSTSPKACGDASTAMLLHGTTGIEAKSGYGLDAEERAAESPRDPARGAQPSDHGDTHLPRSTRRARRTPRASAPLCTSPDRRDDPARREPQARPASATSSSRRAPSPCVRRSGSSRRARNTASTPKVHADQFRDSGACAKLAARVGAISVEHVDATRPMPTAFKRDSARRGSRSAAALGKPLHGS